VKYRCASCDAGPESLRREKGSLVCDSCGNEYSDRGGFYDFLGEEEPANERVVSIFDAVSRVYETPVWYPLAVSAATAGRSSSEELVERVAESVASEGANDVVDVACGTGFFARGIARSAPEATVYGVDASEEMLRRAVHKARHEGVSLELARADACALPYADASFDAATCCGALHLLPDPEGALREMARVLRPEGLLVVTTLVDEPPFGAPPLRESMRLIYGMTVFETDGLEKTFAEAGFEVVDARREASMVTLTARRRR